MRYSLSRWHLLLAAYFGSLIIASGVPPFKIAKKEDIGFNDLTTKRHIIRWEYRVVVPATVSDADLELIANSIVETAKQETPFHAIGMFFYLPGSDTENAYTAGKAVYAPNGEWGDARNVEAGNYQAHRLVVISGNAFVIKAPQTTTELTETQKKKLFYDLVSLQDSGLRPMELTYKRIAQQYGVTYKDVTDIQLEGTAKNWPVPEENEEAIAEQIRQIRLERESKGLTTR